MTDTTATQPDGLSSVMAILRSEGDDPSMFFADIEQRSDGVLVYHLWHQSALLPENRRVIGNPGGKCRDIVFNPRTGKASVSSFWQ